MLYRGSLGFIQNFQLGEGMTCWYLNKSCLGNAPPENLTFKASETVI